MGKNEKKFFFEKSLQMHRNEQKRWKLWGKVENEVGKCSENGRKKKIFFFFKNDEK